MESKTVCVLSKPGDKLFFDKVLLTDRKECSKKHNVYGIDGCYIEVLLNYSYNDDQVFSYECQFTDTTVYVSENTIKKEYSKMINVDSPLYSKEEVELIAKSFTKKKYFPILPNKCFV